MVGIPAAMRFSSIDKQRHEMRIAGFVVGADRAAEHDHERRIERIWGIDAPTADVEIAHEMAAVAERQFEIAQIFEIDVADRQDFMFHRQDSVALGLRMGNRPRSLNGGATGTV